MKLFLILLVATKFIFAQEYKIIPDPRDGDPMLIGKIEKDLLKGEDFSWWYNIEYDEYEIDKEFADSLKSYLNDYNITIVLGTWCGDSHIQIPRFFKIIEYIGLPDEKITIFSVDRKKKGIADEVENLNIERIPTIIIYLKEKEIGRIIESPKESLEKDLLSILSESKK